MELITNFDAKDDRNNTEIIATKKNTPRTRKKV